MRKNQVIAFLIFFLLPCAAHADDGTRLASQAYQKANKLFAAEHYKEALPLYKQVLASPPDDVSVSDIYTRIADSFFRLGDYRSALDAYRGALRGQRRSARPATQYWVGFCCFLIGRDEEAVNELLKIPELYPDSGRWVSTAYYWAGRASERMGRRDRAAEYYRKAGGDGRSTQGRFALKKAEAVKGGQ